MTLENKLKFKKVGNIGYRGSVMLTVVTMLYNIFFGTQKEMATDLKYIKLELQDQSKTIFGDSINIHNLTETVKENKAEWKNDLTELKMDCKNTHSALWKYNRVTN